MMSCDIFNYIP